MIDRRKAEAEARLDSELVTLARETQSPDMLRRFSQAAWIAAVALEAEMPGAGLTAYIHLWQIDGVLSARHANSKQERN